MGEGEFDNERFAAVRAAFPITAERAYLFAGGMAPLSTPSHEALEEYAQLSATDPVAAYRDYPPAEASRLRETVAGFLNAGPLDLAIVDSTSRGNNLAAQMIESPAGSNVVVDSTTYPSALLPWLLKAKAHVEMRRVADKDGRPRLEDFARLVDDRTVAVSVSHVCRTTGFRHRLTELAELAHARDALLVIDAAQSVGVVPIDVERDGVDVMTFGAMKWLLGVPGVAFLYVRPSLAGRLEVAQAGPAGSKLVGTHIDHEPGGKRYELSSGHWGGFAASRRGAELLSSLPPTEVELGVLHLSGLLVDGLRERGFRVHTPSDPARRAGIVAFEYAEPRALRRHLLDVGVDVWGWDDRRLMRADPHLYNNPSDIDRFFAGLESYGPKRAVV